MMATGKEEDNTQFIQRLMTYGCPTGPLSQVFVIEALRAYSAQVAKTPAEKLTFGPISGEAWKATAAWYNEEIEKRLSR